MALGTPVAAAAAYSATAGATSIAPAYPAGITATDALILFVGQKPTAANGGTVTTPAGWTLRDEITAAGGYGTTIGADSGNTNLRIYTKNTVAGTETGTLTVTLAGSDVAWGFIVQVPTQGGALSYGTADGQRTTAPTAGTAFAVALTNGTTATAFANGDLALWAMCVPTDVTTPAQFSAQSITATGATFGAATEINEPDNGTGNDIGGYSAWASVTAGSSSVAPTVTVTAGGTVTNVRGPIVLLRIRETFPPITGTFSATESADVFDSKLKAPTVGTVAYSSALPTSISVAYPAGISANDALVLFVAAKGTTESDGRFSEITGWTSQAQGTAGGYPSNIASLNAGNISYAVYVKQNVTGAESGFQAVPLAFVDVAFAVIVKYPLLPQRIPKYLELSTQGFVSGDTYVPRLVNFFPSQDVGSGQSALNTNDVFLYFGAASTAEFSPNTYSGHIFGDISNTPPQALFSSVKQLNQFSTNTSTRISGFAAWADVRNSTSTSDSFSFAANLLVPPSGSSAGGALSIVRIRQVTFISGSVSATEQSDSFAARPPRPELGVRTGSLNATESPDTIGDEYTNAAVYGYVTSWPLVGAIAYSATTSILPVYPTGINANSILIMWVAQKPSAANGGSVVTPTGWTLQGQKLAGGGYGTTLGVDTGNQNLWVFTKNTVAGTETGSVTVTLGTTNTAWAAIAAVNRNNAHPVSYLTFAGESLTPSSFVDVYAPVTVANPGDRFDFKPSDIVMLGLSIASDNSTPTNFNAVSLDDSLSRTGFYNPPLKLAEPDSALGSDIGGFLGWSRPYISYAPGASELSFVADSVDTVNSAGPFVALRIRFEYPAATGSLAATEAADSFSGAGGLLVSPLVVRGTRTSSASGTTSHAVLMPAQTVLGDVVIVTFRPSSAAVITPPANFSLLYQGDSRTAVFVSTAASTGSYTFGTNVSVSSNHAVYAVQDGIGVSAAGAIGTSASPDAPQSAGTFSASSDILWVVCYGSRSTGSGTAATFTSAPAGYALDTIVSGDNGYAAMSHSIAGRALTVDPPNATAAVSVEWVAVTVGISSQPVPGSPLAATPATFTLAGADTALTVARQYRLTATVASASLTGNATGVVRSRTVLADLGSVAAPVYDASIQYGRSLAAEVAGYTINSPPTAFQASLVTPITVASFAVAGADAGLLAGLQLPVTVSPFALAGLESQLVGAALLTADSASIAIDTTASGLTAARQLPLDPEQFQQSAFDTGLTRTAALAADTSTLDAQTYSADVLAGRLISGDTSAFSLSGSAADFPAVPPPITLIADTAEVLVGAFDVVLRADTTGPLGTGTFTATATQATLNADRRLAADPGAFTAATTATALYTARSFVAEPAGFSTDTNAASVLRGKTVVAATESLALSGFDTAFFKGGIVAADPAAITQTGSDTRLSFGVGLPAQTTTVSVSGSDTRLSFGFGLRAQTTAISVAGSASFFRRPTLPPASDTSAVGGEVRKAMRPIEIRSTSRPFDVTGAVRPAERRTATHS